MTIRLLIVGGFLGAGKTTLLWESARHLASQGKRVGLITNDQAPNLVDTVYLSKSGVNIVEVSGSCFCCNYQGLLDSIAHLTENSETDVVIAEPVGSCTDLSATILQPLKDHSHATISLAPLSVLADPALLARIIEGRKTGLHPSAEYIFIKQLEESDIIVISKSDMIEPKDMQNIVTRVQAMYPGKSVFPVSATTGQGLQEWLDEVQLSQSAGNHLLEIDYDTYAEGEAVLGWLNASITLHGETDWNIFLNEFLNHFNQRMRYRYASIGHIKLLLESGSSTVIGNITSTTESISIRGKAEPAQQVRLILNARVEMSPEMLERETRDILSSACGQSIRHTIEAWNCLSPGRPEPTHRYQQLVQIEP